MPSGPSLSRAPFRKGAGFAGLCLAIAAGAFAPAPAFAAAGVFTNLSGSWGGSGTIETSTGKERIRCKVTYTVDGTGNNLDQALKCASDSYKFEVQSSLHVAGGALSGSWSELTQNVNGTLSGKADSGHITGAVTGIGFTASISVTTHGDEQSVTIAPDGTDVKSVSVKMKKSGR